MIETIGCLSYTPLGYGTPQIVYLLRDLARHYRVRVPAGVFAPRWESHPDRDDQFPDLAIHHFWPINEHRAAMGSVVPELVAYIKSKRFRRLGVYGAGTHTKALLELWRIHQGPDITTLITSEVPAQPEFAGLPVKGIEQLEPHGLDFVILSSRSFEKEMASSMRRHRPEIPFAAIYDGHLSRYPAGRNPASGVLTPLQYEDFRAASAARWLDAWRPDLLVCTHYTYLEAILKATHHPKFIIYQAFELPGGSDGSPLRSKHWEEHSLLRSRISLAIYPEPERRAYYERLFRWEGVPGIAIYNATPRRGEAPLPPEGRNGKVILQGSLGADRNFVGYLVQRSASRPEFDLYGRLPDQDRAFSILRDRQAALRHGFSYRGLLDNRTVAALRRQYAWSFVSWNPDSFDTLHACPNKFFEAIADGVPPIAGPHPQCREVIEAHDCGILLRDWSLGAFEDGLREAQAVFGTPRYRRLVENCRRAHETELCWEKQFARLRPLLPAAARPRSRNRRPKLFLLDPTLRSEIGHHYHYAQNVLAGSRELGVEAVAGTNRQLTVGLDSAARVYPVYWYDFWGRNLALPNLPPGRRTSAHFVLQTRLILDAEGARPGDHVFVPNISDQDLAALVRYLAAALREPGPRWHLFLRHDVPPEDATRVRSLRSLARRTDRVCFWTDTEELAAQHREAAGVEVGVLPIPVSAQPVPPPPQRRSGPLRVGYLGDARREKGYPWVSGLVRAAQPLVAAGRIAFTIQTVSNGADVECDRVTTELEGLPLGPGGRLLQQRLTTDEYEALLAETDVVLALYEPDAYRRRSSHVVVEALCRGKAVLLTEGTAPARLLPAGAGWSCTDPTEALTVLTSLLDRVSDSTPLVDPAWREELASFHCGRSLAEMLVSTPTRQFGKPFSPFCRAG